ncbi:ExbD/TolR family protein [Alistipes sp. ZOR0009]|jgi:biopolymer transport protein ExbD|uniref:ExbD/TolR family protein n=1 Tax=Alistipes sp. ZOR0009 TaxID=1339253 RepID=UPI0006487C33|nr:biopolymer transporter ExbD [Alistipes sp. ZOR0009]
MKVERKKKGNAIEVYTSSLSDIMFFLLLFFLIISTLVNPSVIKLLLPKTQYAEQVTAEKNVNISITKDLQYYFNDKPVPFQDIEPLLVESMNGNVKLTVILQADNSIPLQNVVDIVGIGNKLKVKVVLSALKG